MFYVQHRDKKAGAGHFHNEFVFLQHTDHDFEHASDVTGDYQKPKALWRLYLSGSQLSGDFFDCEHHAEHGSAKHRQVYASCTLHLNAESERIKFTVFTVVFHATSFMLSLLTLCFTYLKVLKVARFHCKRIDVITMQTLFLLVDIHPSVKQRCLVEQKKRKQRATKKISIFIGSFIICFAPYVVTRLAELLPSVGINRHWGIVSKCLTYSKAASDPFAYSLLRQQYKKVLIHIVNRVLKRDLYPSSGHNSSLDTENDSCLQRIS
nr:G-protein coupled receptor 26-like isoform X3 [Paramormyrops kingsleyae]